MNSTLMNFQLRCPVEVGKNCPKTNTIGWINISGKAIGNFFCSTSKTVFIKNFIECFNWMHWISLSDLKNFKPIFPVKVGKWKNSQKLITLGELIFQVKLLDIFFAAPPKQFSLKISLNSALKNFKPRFPVEEGKNGNNGQKLITLG